MTRYEKVRQEIITIEREIAALRHAVKNERERRSLRQICHRSGQIRETFTHVTLRQWV